MGDNTTTWKRAAFSGDEAHLRTRQGRVWDDETTVGGASRGRAGQEHSETVAKDAYPVSERHGGTANWIKQVSISLAHLLAAWNIDRPQGHLRPLVNILLLNPPLLTLGQEKPMNREVTA